MWERWDLAVVQSDFDGVSIVILPWATYLRAPAHLRPRLVDDPPADIHTLVERVSDVLERVVGIANLWYADDDMLKLVHPGPLHTIKDGDRRLVAMEDNADRFEWLEASADEPCEVRLGVVAQNELVAVATLQDWDAKIGHFGVFTRADARGRGLAPRTASGVIAIARQRDLVPQWRSRIGNDASAAVAARLGFEAIGTQLFVRVRHEP